MAPPSRRAHNDEHAGTHSNPVASSDRDIHVHTNTDTNTNIDAHANAGAD